MSFKAIGRSRHLIAAAAVLLLLTAGAPGTAVRPMAHSRSSNVTWAEHVSPILERRCSSCHAPGHSAAPTLNTYTQAVEARVAIKLAVLGRSMPPWGAVAGFGSFENDHSLSPYESDLIVSWIDGGTLPGPAAGLADTPAGAPAVIAIGQPDLRLDIGADRKVEATRQTYRIPTSLQGDRWIRGWRFYPGNNALVRRARIVVEPDGLLGVWLPDETAVFFPPPQVRRLRRGASVLLEIEYAEPPAPATDRSEIGLYFAAGATAPLEQLRVGKGVTTLRADIEIVAVTPALATAGQSLRMVATRPDRSVEPLLWLSDYDPRFARSYRLRRPASLPRGTQIEVWSFDVNPSVEMAYVRTTVPRLNDPTAAPTPLP